MQNHPEESTFHRGFVWIEKVRFQNGEIWEGDRANAVEKLGDILEAFDESLFEEKPSLAERIVI